MNASTTFLMRTRDRTRFLSSAIDSVLAQTRSDWRLLVVYDGSADNTRELLEEYAERDRRIAVLASKRPLGKTAALNLGLASVRTMWTAILDDDDVAAPQRLERQLDYVEHHPTTVVVGSLVDVIDADGRRRRDFHLGATAAAEVRRALYRRPNPIVHSAAMFKTDAARRVGGYPSHVEHGEDYALWVELASLGELANVPEVLTYLRMHATRSSANPRTAVMGLDQVDATLRRAGETLVGSRRERRAWRAGMARVQAARAFYATRAGDPTKALSSFRSMLLYVLGNPLVLGDGAELLWLRTRRGLGLT